MKGPHHRPSPDYGKRPTERLPASSIETGIRSDKSGPPAGGQSAVIASTSAHLPQVYGQSRIVRERDERVTLEDKVRRAVDSWTAEERATAYWYLYACGMTLERAKSIRHKAGLGA